MTKSFLLSVFIMMFAQTTWAAKHIAVVYETESGWKVDHIKVEDRKLQDLVESRSFVYEYQAKSFAATIKLLNTKSNISVRTVVTETGTRPLWNVTQSWSQDWEDKYSVWIEKNLDANFFVRYGLSTDCADVAYSLRWIFARNNGLPAAATLTGTNAIISHMSAKAEWNDLPGHADWDKDQRFRVALDWVLDNVYTKSLILDAYPVELTRQTVRAGLVHLLGLTHAEVFNKVSYDPEDAPLQVLSSTVPQAVRVLSPRLFMDSAITPENQGGLLQFRWAIKKNQNWDMIARADMPHYSLEQYQGRLCQTQSHFALCLVEKLGMNFAPEKIIRKVLSGIEAAIAARETIVNDGIVYCRINDCAPGTEGYENWGTPSRDKRLAKSIVDTGTLSETLRTFPTYNNWLQYSRLSSLNMGMADLNRKLQSRLTSYDPRDSLESRWGMNTNAISLTQNRRVQEAQKERVALIEKAADCRNSPLDCQRDEARYNELSTTELDHQLRTDLDLYFTHCLYQNCPNQIELRRVFEKSFTQSPAPWDSLEKRAGVSLPAGAHYLQIRKNVSPGSSDHLILDHDKIYKMSERKIVSYEYYGKIYYHKGSRQYLRVGRDFLSVLNDNLIEIKKVPLEQGEYRLLDFKNGQYLIYQCSNGPTEEDCYVHSNKNAFILDVTKMSLSSPMNYFSLAVDQVGGAAILQTSTQPILIQASGANTVVTNLAAVEGQFKGLVTLKMGEALVMTSTSGTKSLFKLTAQNKTRIQNDKTSIRMERINSSFVNVHSSDYYNVKSNVILNKDFEAWSRPGNYQLSISANSDQRFVHEYDLNDTYRTQVLRSFSFDKGNVIPMNLPNFTSQTLMGAGANWLSFADREDKEASVIDYQGRVLESSKAYAKMSCGPDKTKRVCQDSENRLVANFYFVLPLGRTSFHQVSLDNRASVYVSNSAIESAPNKLTLDVGRSIQLTDNLILWLP